MSINVYCGIGMCEVAISITVLGTLTNPIG